MTDLFNKIFKITILFILLAELASFFAYIFPSFGNPVFITVVLLTLAVTAYKLEYGVWLALAELFIGSKGYLFFFEYNELTVSIRIAIWLIIMSVWLGKVVSSYIKSGSKSKESGELNSGSVYGLKFLKSSHFSYFLILFIFIAWGIVNGFLNQNEYSNIFFDFNGWLYLALIFPIYEILDDRQKINTLLQIFSASILWLSLKTFFLLFVFSHNMFKAASELYRWVRITGVGEITQMEGGFSRIFFQSHIFVLIGFFIFLLIFFHKDINYKKNKLLFVSYLLSFTLFLSVILISFSRSFWVGLAFGILLLYLYLAWAKFQWRSMVKVTGYIILSFLFGISLIAATIKFPYPRPSGDFAATKLLSERAKQFSGEAGVSSRWSLLPELWSAISESPILGRGFGTTVTYKSSDPRVLNSNPDGRYTTYAFEWGWLDIWLKLGLFGVLSYLALIGKLFIIGMRNNRNNYLTPSLLIGLAVVAVVSVFSPYLNHPLGLGYLMIVSVMLDNNLKN